MNFSFTNKISVKEVAKIERNLIEILKNFDENFQIVYDKKFSKISSIVFSQKPKGISILREYSSNDNYSKARKVSNKIINVGGIKFFNKKSRKFEDIAISFSHYQLTFIISDFPEKFHKIFDISNIKIENLIRNEVRINNPDKEAVEKILTTLPKNILDKLDLEYCFEIEFEGTNYYTIIDFNDGDYIAIDKPKNIYFLNHNSTEKIKKISDNIDSFLEFYDGSKISLRKKLE